MRIHQLPAIRHSTPPKPCTIAVMLEPAREPIKIVITHQAFRTSTQHLNMTREEAADLHTQLGVMLATPQDARPVMVIPAKNVAEATHRIPTNIHWGKGWFDDGFRYIVAHSNEAAVRFAEKRQCTFRNVQVRDGNGWAKLVKDAA